MMTLAVGRLSPSQRDTLGVLIREDQQLNKQPVVVSRLLVVVPQMTYNEVRLASFPLDKPPACYFLHNGSEETSQPSCPQKLEGTY